MPPLDQQAYLCAQGFPHLLGTPAPFDHGFNVPQPMRPTPLPSPSRVPGIGAPAIRHHLPQHRAPKRSWATLEQRDRRPTQTVTQVVTIVHRQARCHPSRQPVSSR
jgi:hypothetical protein